MSLPLSLNNCFRVDSPHPSLSSLSVFLSLCIIALKQAKLKRANHVAALLLGQGQISSVHAAASVEETIYDFYKNNSQNFITVS